MKMSLNLNFIGLTKGEIKMLDPHKEDNLFRNALKKKSINLSGNWVSHCKFGWLHFPQSGDARCCGDTWKSEHLKKPLNLNFY